MTKGVPNDPAALEAKRERLRALAEKRRNDPEYAARVYAKTHSAEANERRSQALLRLHQDRDIYTPEEHKRRSDFIKQRQSDPQWLAMSVAKLHTPEADAKSREANKRLWDNPEWRARHAERMRDRNRSDSARKKSSETSRRNWADPAYRAARIASGKAQYAAMTQEQRDALVASAVRSHQLGKPSSIEIAVADCLDNLGIAYERQKIIGPITVDFYLPDIHTVLEVQGCYWHGCEPCGYRDLAPANQRRRDQQRYHALRKEGYHVRQVWEHDILLNVDTAVKDSLRL